MFKFSLGICFVLVLSGCLFDSLRPPEWTDPHLSLVWPPAPERARIKLLKVIRGTGDLSIDNKPSPLVNWLTGAVESELPLLSPYGIAADGEGRFWTADIGIHGVHGFDLERRRRTYLFEAGTEVLDSPVGLAIDVPRSLLYVSDSVLRGVFCYDLSGRFISRFKAEEDFGRPTGLAVDRDGNLYVVDSARNCVLVFAPDGRLLRRIGEASGPADPLRMPISVAVDRELNVAVVDSMNFRVVIYDHSGKFVSTIGKLGDVPGAFARPRGVAFDSDGHIYVVDAAFDNIQIFDSAGRLLLYFPKSGKAPGEFSLPSGIFIDRFDRIYVSDTYNRRIQFFQYLSAPAD